MRGRTPARISDDFPHPEGPTTVRIAGAARSGDRSRSAIWVISRVRPKNTRCSPRSNARRPGYGDLSSGQPQPPPPSITLSRDRNRSRASDGSTRGVDELDRLQQGVPLTGSDEARTGSSSVPNARAAPISAAHHTEFRYDAVTTQTTASALLSSSYSRASHSSPGGIPSCCPGRKRRRACLRTATRESARPNRYRRRRD